MPKTPAALGIIVVIALSAGPVAGQPTAPYPVANFNRQPDVEPSFVPPDGFVPLGARTLFTANNPSQGRELWVTDGTAAGTRLLLDICPGPCHADVEVRHAAPGLVFFQVETFDPERPRGSYHALWRTDGTLAGTFPLASGDTSTVGYLSGPGLFLFSARSSAHGSELWSTDGTTEGTRLLEDLVPGPEDSFPGEGAAVGDVLVFPATAPGAGREPWVTDGTSEGTRVLVDLYGGFDSAPGSFRRVGEHVLFGAGPRFVSDLWSTDGTAAGTRLVREGLFNGTGFASEFLVSGSRAFFTLGDFPSSIWTSDGTPAGTRRVSADGLVAYGMRLFGGRLFFVSGTEIGLREPWVADGAGGGARRFLDLCPGTCSSSPTYLGIAGGRLVFAAEDGTRGQELWSTDGTAAGTRILRDHCPGPCGIGFPQPALATGSRVFVFAAGDVLATDGTPAGTTAILDGRGNRPVSFGAVGSRALIPANLSFSSWKLWVSDGTAAGTAELTDFDPPADGSSRPTGLVELAGEVLGNATLDNDFRHVVLLATRGAPATTRTVVSFPDWFGFLLPTRRAGDRVFFVENAFSSAARLWVTDGTAGGSMALGDAPVFTVDAPWGSIGEDLLAFVHGTGVNRISGPPYQVVPLAWVLPANLEAAPDEAFVPLGERVLFPSDRGFWATDGTVAGTVQLDQSPAGDAASITVLSRFGDEVYFFDRFLGFWATDGIPGHARQLCSADWPREDSFPQYLYPVGDRLTFSVDQPAFGPDEASGLWTSDGESDCQRMLPGVTVDSRGFLPGVAAVFEDRLFFASDDGLHGSELWVSDGTPEGTHLLADLRPGPGESRPHRMRVVGDRLFFTATDGAHGYELWSTDGTAAGTARLGDIAPGPSSSDPAELTAAGGTLVFSADDASHGRELWSLPLAIPSCGDPATLCLHQGRFRAQVRWRDPRSGEVGGGTALPFPGSDRTGMFWFFNAANVELIVKALDGGPVNGFHWLFYGGLSDVEYWLTVTDAQTGTTKAYRNPPHEICGRGDTAAFPSDSMGAPPRPAPRPLAPEPAFVPLRLVPRPAAFERRPAPDTAGSCQPDAQVCLLDGRFRVEVEWHDQRSGDEGVGGAIPGTDRSGFFWFFDPANVELVVKALDGRTVNGRFWVFYGALSDIEYTIRVVDTQTGSENVYHNPPGEICGRADTTAF